MTSCIEADWISAGVVKDNRLNEMRAGVKVRFLPT